MKPSLLALIAGSLLATPVAAEMPPLEAYRQLLMPCLQRAKACKLSSLTQSDRDYLAYELKGAKLSARDVDLVATSRMSQFRYGPVPIAGAATGDLPARLRKATVMVLARNARGVAEGSGFWIGRNLVVTNRHVVESATGGIMILSTESNLPLVGSIAAITPGSTPGDPDLAAIWVSDTAGIEVLKFAPPAATGAMVASGFPGNAIGPEGFWRRAQVGDFTIPSLTLTSGQGASIEQSQSGTELIRHAAAVFKGNSGGPLVDACGGVVGVNTFLRGQQSYALSSRAIMAFLDKAGLPYGIETAGCESPASIVKSTAPAASQR